MEDAGANGFGSEGGTSFGEAVSGGAGYDPGGRGFGAESFGSEFSPDRAFRDVLADVERAVDEANLEAQKEAAQRAPEYEIPGPLNPRDIERAPPEDRGFVGRVGQTLKNYLTNRAVQTGIQYGTQVVGPAFSVPVSIAQLMHAKFTGATEEDLDRMALGQFGNIMTGGLLGATVGIGKTAQRVAKALGAKGGDQPGFGETPSTGMEAQDVYAAVERARETGELTRQTPPELLREARAAREA